MHLIRKSEHQKSNNYFNNNDHLRHTRHADAGEK